MTKETFLTEYTNIENTCFIKAEKNKRITILLNQFKETETISSIEEVAEISNYLLNNEITIRQPVFAAIIYPCLNKGVEEGDVRAIRTLIKLAYPLQHYQSYTKNYQYSTRSLVLMGLKIAPDDLELLNLYEKDIRDYLLYTLHELPTGVLHGSDGSDIEGCDELLQLVTEYEYACQKLGLDRREIIKECRFYYFNYKIYLLSRLLDSGSHLNFKDYLTVNGDYSG